jgi:chromosome segregation ATPase
LPYILISYYSETRYIKIRKELQRETEDRITAEARAQEVLNILIDKNYEIDELGVKIDTLNNVNKRLRSENTDLNQEALDLENKIHLMDKMYKSMQLTYDKASENLLKSQIAQKDIQINSLEDTILEIQKDFDNFKENTKETINKQITRDVSTDSF